MLVIRILGLFIIFWYVRMTVNVCNMSIDDIAKLDTDNKYPEIWEYIKRNPEEMSWFIQTFKVLTVLIGCLFVWLGLYLWTFNA